MLFSSPPGAFPHNLSSHKTIQVALGTQCYDQSPTVFCAYGTHQIQISKSLLRKRPSETCRRSNALKQTLITNLSALVSTSFQFLCTPKHPALQLRPWLVGIYLITHYTCHQCQTYDTDLVHVFKNHINALVRCELTSFFDPSNKGTKVVTATNQSYSAYLNHSAYHNLSPYLLELPVLTSQCQTYSLMLYSVVNVWKAWHAQMQKSLQSSGLISTFCSVTQPPSHPFIQMHLHSLLLEVLLFPTHDILWHPRFPGFTNGNPTTESIHWVYGKELNIL